MRGSHWPPAPTPTATPSTAYFQLIVSDHANLPDQWDQDCVRYNWRNGEALIPQDWIDEHAG
ncbi:DUF3732 domain-containing protein [Streptomyces sp. NPDC050546]|uniref:DUF3732 domain-containing protein n=1 Tax=Streptomyces sp. NPDC050546 TaxID=3365628 RepID=UPI0037A9A9EB